MPKGVVFASCLVHVQPLGRASLFVSHCGPDISRILLPLRITASPGLAFVGCSHRPFGKLCAGRRLTFPSLPFLPVPEYPLNPSLTYSVKPLYAGMFCLRTFLPS